MVTRRGNGKGKSGKEASIRTGIIIQDLCYRMELPCYVCGFTTSGFGLQIINYVDQDIDGKDKYRITGMQSRSGTPTEPAMKYMAQKLKKETAEKRLLIVSTDGCSNSGRDGIQKTIKELSRYGILVVGAGIGSARAQVENEFGKNFIDIGNLEAMPTPAIALLAHLFRLLALRCRMRKRKRKLLKLERLAKN